MKMLWLICLMMALVLPSAQAQEESTMAYFPMDNGYAFQLMPTEEGYQPTITDGSGSVAFAARRPAMITIATGITMKNADVGKGYDAAETLPDGRIQAVAQLTTQKGSVVQITDIYSASAGGVMLERTVEVIKANDQDKGFRSVVSFEADPVAFKGKKYDALEYFIPSLLYRNADNIVDRGSSVFVSATFAYEKNFARETRSGLPMVMARNPENGATMSVGHIMDGVSDEITQEKLDQAIRVDTATRYGAIGMTRLLGEGPAICYTYPYVEEPRVGKSCFHPVTEGEKQTYRLMLFAGETKNYNEAMIRFYTANYACQPIRIADIDTSYLYEVCVSDLSSLYVEHGLGRGLPFACFVDNGEHHSLSFQIGFIGMQTTLAHHMVRYGIAHNDADSYQKGVAMLDFWATYAVTDSGMVKNWFDDYSFRTYPPFLRCICDGMEGMLDAWLCMQAAGKTDGKQDRWISMVKRYADLLVRVQNEDGSFYRCYDYQGNGFTDENTDGLVGDFKTVGLSKLNSAIAIRFLVRLWEATGEQKYLDTAIRCGDFVLAELYPDGNYVGGTPDNPNTVDKEAGMYAAFAYSALYAATGRDVYLQAMEQAMVYTMSWAYTYSIHATDFKSLMGGVPLTMGMSDGLSFIAAGHSAVDSYLAVGYYEMFKLYVWTGKEIYRDMAHFLEKNTKQTMNLNNRWGFAKESFMCEATNVSDFHFITADVRGVWLPWITSTNVEPVCAMERTFGSRSVEKFSAEDLPILRQKLDVYGAGGKVY